VLRSVRLPRQRVCPILPGVRSFLNYGGMVSALFIFVNKGRGSI
jgi:hypothetical protein